MENLLDKATIVDVRTPEEFEDEHFPGAVNIPLDQLQYRLEEFREMKTPIVAYCRSGSRSGLAVSILKQRGINEVYNGGGLQDMLRQAKTTRLQ
ncbi:MAG TPA: rhodanese-like domain-containing protein [Chitinophagaceae bacterium]